MRTRTNNLLNQVTSRGVPGTNDMIGLAHVGATVLINGQSPSRKGEYYHKEMGTNNSSGAASAWVTNVAVFNGSTQTVVGRVIFPKNGESLAYNADGNLTSDSRFSYFWDAENRLTRIGSALPSDVRFVVDSTYDFLDRRVSKTVSNYVAGAYVLDYQRRFLYEGWNLAAELNSTNGLLRTHIWGLDLSGSLQGAGGVGGLLATIFHTGTNAGTYFPAYDGNGNVARYVNASNGVVVAEYEYGSFGEMIRASGPMAKEFNFLFSTKYYDWETGLYYYGHRYLRDGKWLSRDPIEEKRGGPNLYGFVVNNPLTYIDTDGREIYAYCPNCLMPISPFDPKPHVCPSKPPPKPGSSGTNAKQFFTGYLFESCCSAKKDRLSPIPGVSTPSSKPIQGFGPVGGDYQIYPFPNIPTSAVGSAGGQTCSILVVKCPDFVAVFHFTGGDSPSGTLRRFSWPSSCSAIMCGSDDRYPQSNCLADDTKSAAKAVGLNIVGVSGNSACGVNADGKWWQWGN